MVSLESYRYLPLSATGKMLRALTVLSLLFSKPPQPSGLNITVLQPDVPFVPHPRPLSGAASDSKEIIRQFVQLDRSTKWKLVDKVKFEGDTYEPEGLVRIGDDRYFVSAGEYIVPTVKYNETINGTDRTAGEGFAHMIIFDGKGKRIADASISQAKSLEVCPSVLQHVLPRVTAADRTSSITTVASTMMEPTSGLPSPNTAQTQQERS